MFAEELAESFYDRHGPPGSGDVQRKVAKEMHQEAKFGSAVSQIYQVVLGTKKHRTVPLPSGAFENNGQQHLKD